MNKPYVQRDEYLDLVGEPEKAYQLSERFFSFAVNVIRQVRTLPDSKEYIPKTKWFESFSLVAAPVSCVEKPPRS